MDAWSPDGQTLAVHHHQVGGGRRVLTVRPDRQRAEVQPFVEDESFPEGAAFSPDDRFLRIVTTTNRASSLPAAGR